jgi:hypothetical protein
MGFQKPDLGMAYDAIRQSIGEISSPYNDGFTGMHCKQELYMLKCWLEDRYNNLPKFSGEEKWEQNRVFEILKKD